MPYREFSKDFETGQTYLTNTKQAGSSMKMVLDGQQRLQALYLAVCGSYDKRRLYFNVTSGPESREGDSEPSDTTGRNFRFEFWRDEEPNRGRRLIRVSDVAGWAPRFEEDEIAKVISEIPLDGDQAKLASKNLRLLRRCLSATDLVPVEIIDEEIFHADQARSINEVLDIFVRVNSGGTRLTKSDLMFSLIKTKWEGARHAFDRVLEKVDPLEHRTG